MKFSNASNQKSRKVGLVRRWVREVLWQAVKTVKKAGSKWRRKVSRGRRRRLKAGHRRSYEVSEPEKKAEAKAEPEKKVEAKAKP